MTNDANVGRLIGNRYLLKALIGQGSMGKVYLAEDALFAGVPVAIKFLSQTLLDTKMRERFFREAMTCAQLGQKSIHVVRVLDYGVTDDDQPFYSMEYIHGQNLGKIIQSEPLPVPRFLGFVRQICLGLEAAHNGIVLKNQVIPIIHRDIKPSNIIVTQDPSMGEMVKILDFGIAKLMQVESDQTSTFMGTLAYASPEQMEGGRDQDNRSDIYSLGVMMYQMLSGYLPIRPSSNNFGSWYNAHQTQQPKPLSQLDLATKIPKLLDDTILRCLEKDRDFRPKTVGRLLEELKPLDQRFGPGFEVSQMINTTLAKKPVTQTTRALVAEDHSEEERFCRLQMWPKGKPIAEIVFPVALKMSAKTIPTLWVMLPREEIERRQQSTRYNNFICTLSPHPMTLWLTAMYSNADGPRWFPVYLDLKNPDSQRIVWLLGECGYYQVLFFSKDAPHRCELTHYFNIASQQRKYLKEWVITANTAPSVGSPNDSKDLMKREYINNLKPRILMNFESMHSDSQPGGDWMGL
jgi:eukaryotic-like serine/threonine-protein kinase